MSAPSTSHATVGTINIAAVNVSDLLRKLTDLILRHGVDLDLYIQGNTLVIFTTETPVTWVKDDERTHIVLDLIQDLTRKAVR